MYILSDFSKTFTRADMPTTWSVFAKSGILGEAYIRDRNKLFDEYYHYEQEGNIEKTNEWFFRHAELFVQYKLSESQIDMVLLDDRYFAPREGIHEFLHFLDTHKIPLIIVTSGVSYFVKRWFELRYQFVPHAIYGTQLLMEHGIVTGIVKDSIICPQSKGEREYSSESMRTILLGDSHEDMMMSRAPILSLGFTDTHDMFDITLGKDGSFASILALDAFRKLFQSE